MLKWGVWIYQRDLHNLRIIPIFLEFFLEPSRAATPRPRVTTSLARVTEQQRQLGNILLKLTETVKLNLTPLEYSVNFDGIFRHL